MIQRGNHKKTVALPDYTFFSGTHGAISRIDLILGHKKNFNKFKNIQIISKTSLIAMIKNWKSIIRKK